MNNYIEGKIYGLPTPSRLGWNTSVDKKRKNKEYVFKVCINSSTYYKVHVGRKGKSKIKYFKKFQDAKMFALFLRENKYI